MDFLDGIGAHWLWITFGLLLAALEILVPGVFLIWFAVAAIVTGVLTGLLDLSFAMQVVDFAFLALITVFSARRYFGQEDGPGPDPLMNQRGARMVGENALVVQTIEHGSGRVHIGDSDWIAHGPDVAMGQRVRVVGSQGAILLVEPITLLEGDVAGDVAGA